MERKINFYYFTYLGIEQKMSFSCFACLGMEQKPNKYNTFFCLMNFKEYA